MVFSLKDPDGDVISWEFKECIKEKIQTIEDSLYADEDDPDGAFDNPDSKNYWKNYIDEKSLIDWILLEECAKNPDSNMYSSCYVFFNPADQKLHFGPVWDFDLGFGNVIGAACTGCKTKTPWTYNGVTVDNWFRRLMKSQEFLELLKLRYQSVYEELNGYLSNYKNILFDNLKSSIKMNFTRWCILGKETYKCPAGYAERVTYSDEIDYLSEWLTNRFNWINENL